MSCAGVWWPDTGNHHPLDCVLGGAASQPSLRQRIERLYTVRRDGWITAGTTVKRTRSKGERKKGRGERYGDSQGAANKTQDG